MSGRSQLIIVGSSEMASMAASEFSKMNKVANDPRLEQMRRVGFKIVMAARPDDPHGILPPANKWSSL